MFTDFNKTISISIEDKYVDYGFVFGSDPKKVLFIKAGLDGSMKGYQNKYLDLAYEVNQKYGITVICSSNPIVRLLLKYNPIEQGLNVLDEELGNIKEKDIYYMGFSKGAYYGCYYGCSFPEIKRLLLINPPLRTNTVAIQKAIKNFSKETMTFLFGSEDPSIGDIKWIDFLKNEKVKIEIIENKDHYFSKDHTQFITLVEEYLLYDIKENKV